MSKTLKRATALVLVGFTFMWSAIMLGNYWTSREYHYWAGAEPDGSYGPGIVKLSTYIFLIAIAGMAFFTVASFRSADTELAKKTSGALPVFRFATTGVIISLVSLAVFAISAFFASFNSYGADPTIAEMILGVYLPILLAATFCIIGILSVTVYRKSSDDSKSLGKEAKRAKREAALAFIYPIVGTTIALIIGLVVYQSRRENPQAWVWVLILAIVAGSVVMGSIYSARTKTHAVRQATPIRVPGTAALNLNFVLVVMFVVIVSLMAFSFGIGAISELDYRYGSGYPNNPPAEIVQWWLKSMAPAIVMVALVDLAAYIAVRIRSLVASH